MQWTLEKRLQVHTFHNLTQSGESFLASLSRKTIRLRSGELHRTGRRRDRTLFDILARDSNERPFTCFSQNQERLHDHRRTPSCNPSDHLFLCTLSSRGYYKDTDTRGVQNHSKRRFNEPIILLRCPRSPRRSVIH